MGTLLSIQFFEEFFLLYIVHNLWQNNVYIEHRVFVCVCSVFSNILITLSSKFHISRLKINLLINVINNTEMNIVPQFYIECYVGSDFHLEPYY